MCSLGAGQQPDLHGTDITFSMSACAHARSAAPRRYQILYFQLSGFGDIATAKINLFFNLGNAFGMLLGGVLGDAAAKRFPRTARPLINMASMCVAGPLNIVLYRGMPGASLYPAPNSATAHRVPAFQHSTCPASASRGRLTACCTAACPVRPFKPTT